MQCPTCKQLWKVDEWDKYQTFYAVKIASQENWEEFDSRSLIEEKIIKNKGGLEKEYCMIAKCINKQVKGSAFCANICMNLALVIKTYNKSVKFTCAKNAHAWTPLTLRHLSRR